MTNYSMFELCYDILDELTEPREINAAQVAVEQDVETQDSMTPEEFCASFDISNVKKNVKSLHIKKLFSRNICSVQE